MVLPCKLRCSSRRTRTPLYRAGGRRASKRGHRSGQERSWYYGTERSAGAAGFRR
ncbi:hypothetical protein C8T65DRAFT_671888 [Cerioporus squamosus]|nr:hypothetical protein C8T65DRAFT_671888 [Cerioporus squamosus]